MVDERGSAHPMIWWGFVFAPLVYVGLILFVLPAQGALPAGSALPAILAGVGVVQAAVAQVMWVQVKRGTLKMTPALDGAPTPWPVIVWALDEAPAVLGLVVFILGGPRALAFGLIGLSLVALLLNPYWTLGGDA